MNAIGRRIKLIAELLMILNLATFASTSKIDSLKTVAETSTEDTIRAEALILLAQQLYYANPDTATILCNQAIQLLGNVEVKPSISLILSQTYNTLGAVNYVQGNYPGALNYYEKSMKIYEALDNKKGMAHIYNNTGVIYKLQSDYPKALKWLIKSLRIKEELKDERGMSATYNNIGMIFHAQSDYDRALEWYLKSMKVKERLNDRKGMAVGYMNIGVVYKKQSNYEKALEWLMRGLKIDEELNDKKSMASSCNNIGILYTELFYEDTNLTWLGKWAETRTNLLDTALYFQNRALKINMELKDNYLMAYSLSSIGGIYKLQKDWNEALSYYRRSVVLATSTGALKEESSVHKYLSYCYEQIGNFNLSLIHFKKHTALRDSIFNEQKSKELGKLEAKYEFESAEAERKSVKEEQAKQQATQKSRRDNLQYSGILIFLVLIFASVFMLGRINIPIRLAEGMIFFSFLLFFEFTLVLLDPYIEQYSSGAPAIKLGFNAVLAGMIFPLHHLFEIRLKKRLISS